MPTRNLGRTGHRTGIFSLGGQAAIEQPNNEAVAVPIIERALDLGVNYVDTAAMYGGKDRWSQRYFGQVMKHRRSQVYLASKTHDRTRDGSLALLEESLKLLNTDHLDAWQLHHIDSKEDVEQIFGKGGALEALLHAREQKMVRYLGVTGHSDPEVLMECLRRFDFDQILMALNAADAAPPQLYRTPAAHGGGQTDGHHRHEDSRPRAHSQFLAARQEPRLGLEPAGSEARRSGDERSALFYPQPAREHRHHRMRYHRPTRRKRATRARLHAAQRNTNGRPDRTHGANRKAGAVLSELGVAPEMNCGGKSALAYADFLLA